MKEKKGYFCLFHQACAGHTIQDCQNFLVLVQKMMNVGEIELCKKVKGEIVAATYGGSLGASNDGRQEEMPIPLTIYYK